MKYKVVDKATGTVYRAFATRAEAQYYITDVFGPEWSTVEIQHA